ncbi:3894_t:CDS:2 [Ambispora leptoticha]|uniref:3894_t:CDS:1 n=1 Tax=Ambispora leptoticha TaxID=144679 RepID=A0A9N8ZM04_9GLOM|nr:3894_t:CDS:2 [Ambispora leptoticha]
MATLKDQNLIPSSNLSLYINNTSPYFFIKFEVMGNTERIQGEGWHPSKEVKSRTVPPIRNLTFIMKRCRLSTKNDMQHQHKIAEHFTEMELTKFQAGKKLILAYM